MSPLLSPLIVTDENGVTHYMDGYTSNLRENGMREWSMKCRRWVILGPTAERVTCLECLAEAS